MIAATPTTLFAFGCIPTRLLTVYVAKTYKNVLPYMAPIAVVIAVGFMLIYLFKLRETGAETFGEKIWWNDLRPVHSILYATFAYMAVYHPNSAWPVLLVDLMIGTGAWANHRLM